MWILQIFVILVMLGLVFVVYRIVSGIRSLIPKKYLANNRHIVWNNIKFLMKNKKE